MIIFKLKLKSSSRWIVRESEFLFVISKLLSYLNGKSAHKSIVPIWRFIAVIFLAHAGVLDVMQHGQEILVMKHETNRERQNIPGEPEDIDGVERSVGGIET